jgi:hypothetical protein
MFVAHLRRPAVLGLRTLVLAAVGSLSLACQGDTVTDPRPSLAASGTNGKNAPVHITPESATLTSLQQAVQLTTNGEVTWSSLTPGVAAVDQAGRVTSLDNGIGLIRALSIGGKKADTAEITVQQVAVSLQVSRDSVRLNQFFGSDTVIAVVADANGYPIVSAIVDWISDLLSVVTVSNGILVPAGDTGSTTVRALFGSLTDTVWVSVPASPYP